MKGYVCDVTDEKAVQKTPPDEADLGAVDILVNNAGIIRRIPMHEMDPAEWRRVIDIDLTAPFIVAKAVLPSMMERRSGKIINICSMMSELGRETVSAYAAAKGGLKMLTRNIASEYGAYNIQCNGIGPGYIATPQTAPLRERQSDGDRHRSTPSSWQRPPQSAGATPRDLEGRRSSWPPRPVTFNGHVLYVDGGILAYIPENSRKLHFPSCPASALEAGLLCMRSLGIAVPDGTGVLCLGIHEFWCILFVHWQFEHPGCVLDLRPVAFKTGMRFQKQMSQLVVFKRVVGPNLRELALFD